MIYYIYGECYMKKIFKSKKNKSIYIKKIILLLLISFFVSYILSRISIFKNNNFIELLKNTSMNEIKSNDLNIKGEYLINVGLTTFDDIKFTKEVFKQSNIKKDIGEPKIYIYNTHQTEEYRTIENYNLTPTVYTAAYILKDMLKEYNINVIVEDSDLKTDLNNMGLNYNGSYTVSRNWLEKLNNPNLDLYIDLHRDSVKYEYSNITIDGKDYAKIMFVVGMNHDYENNMKVVDKLIEELEKINKDISRGKYLRKTAIFNQDFNDNCVLIELGGPESTYESISNSLSILALAIKNYLGE